MCTKLYIVLKSGCRIFLSNNIHTKKVLLGNQENTIIIEINCLSSLQKIREKFNNRYSYKNQYK
jgi:hypothetical protein